MITAADKDLPVRVVANGSQAGPGDSSRFEAIIVREGSDIEVPKDLEGKTVSVNALGTIGSLLIDAALEKEGVDVSKINYTEIPFSDVNAAIETGRIDAGYQTEPFVTGGQSSGMRVLLHQYEVLAPEVAIANYFTSAEYADEHPEVVERFQKAVEESLTYASEHEDEVRAVLATYTSIPAELTQEMILPAWNPDLDADSDAVRVVVDAAVEAGLVSEAPDLDALFLG
jgi:NitT/TauT family transport system substrate-binding protein